MVTISHLVKDIIQKKPIIQEAIIQDIASFALLAENLQPEIEKELGKKVKLPAIVMALRRHAEELKSKHKPIKFDFSSEIIMKTNLCDIAVQKSTNALLKLKQLQSLVSYEKGDILNMIHGTTEISIITNQKYKDKILKLLKGEKIINIEEDLVSLSLRFSKEFFYTPGVISSIIRKLSWEGVNIFEIISTFTELTIITGKKDAVKGYNALESMMER
ncbi:ACT domain-containing protein [Candidatus Woesearchaeota archaeon]|nr:ACT domain-containing protein [Candidatus Woesearchaeota archaeon]